jgi:hypothetical protein
MPAPTAILFLVVKKASPRPNAFVTGVRRALNLSFHRVAMSRAEAEMNGILALVARLA